MIFLILVTALPPILAQYMADTGMKPDVTFGDNNERFDISELIQHQNKQYDKLSNVVEDMDDFRRYLSERNQNLRIGRISRRSDSFARHDDMNSDEGGSLADFEDNLKKFKANRRAQRLLNHLHGNQDQPQRRSNVDERPDPEKEVLMHYALPIEMTINGYLQQFVD